MSFIQLTQTAASDGELTDGLMARISEYGVTHLAAGVICDARRTFKRTVRFGKANIAWRDVYFDKQLYRDDAVLDYSLRAQRGEYWDRAVDMTRLSRGAQRVFSHAASAGLHDGFVAPVAVLNGDIVAVAFQGERLDRHPDVETVLRSYAIHYGMEGHRLASGSRVRSGRFGGLTARQLLVLQLAAVGHTNRQIAQKLHVTVKGVEDHLRKVRDALGAKNTKEAIAIMHAAPAISGLDGEFAINGGD